MAGGAGSHSLGLLTEDIQRLSASSLLSVRENILNTTTDHVSERWLMLHDSGNGDEGSRACEQARPVECWVSRAVFARTGAGEFVFAQCC